MDRNNFHHDGLTFSYLDEGGKGRTLIALHAHWMEGLSFVPLAEALAPEWRVIALDQRGHGHSDHPLTYTRADYIGDVEALFVHLGLNEAVVLGNSLGGVNAYQFAARHPERVKALIIEDIGVEVSTDISFSLPWEGTFASREALAERIGPRLAPYLENSFRRTPSGWRLAFDPQDMVVSQNLLIGDHWEDWLATTCMALVIRGRDSRVTNAEQMEEMAVRRPNTRLQTLDGGHLVHIDNSMGFIEAVKTFLASCPKVMDCRTGHSKDTPT
jgi:esterase